MKKIPENAIGKPIGAKSSKPNPGRFISRKIPLVMIFVVVSKVAIPPMMVPNARGISNRDDEIFERRATPDMTGNNKEAAAILFMKRDNNAAAVITPKVIRRGPAPNRRTMNAPRRSVAPECLNPSARMNADIIMMTAERLNPENASCGVKIPLSPGPASTTTQQHQVEEYFERAAEPQSPGTRM